MTIEPTRAIAGRARALVFALSCAAAAASSAVAGEREIVVPALSPAAEAGKVAFEAHCARCHGLNAAGTDKGPTFLDRVYHPGHHADPSFVLAVTRGAAGSGVAATVQVDVRNTGDVAGSTVVQVYARDPIGVSNVVRPWKRLVAFLRTDSIAHGASARVTVDIVADDLAVHDDAMVFRVVPGEYMITVGDSSVTDTLEQALVM